MQASEFVTKICKEVDPHGQMSLEACLEKALYLIKTNEIVEEDNNTRSLPELLQLVQQASDSLPKLAQHTDAAIVLAALNILVGFCIKIIDKTEK